MVFNHLRFLTLAGLLLVPLLSYSQDKKPNFLIIWGDDIGYWNVSAYNQGMMGYETPNIDRIAKEGMLFTHAYGEPRSSPDSRVFVPAC